MATNKGFISREFITVLPNSMCRPTWGENTLRNAEYGMQNSTTILCRITGAECSAVCWQ